MPVAGDARVVDLSLHGLIGIRLVDAQPWHVEHVARQFGAERAEHLDAPELVLRFEETVSRGPMTRLGLISAAMTDQGLVLLEGGSGDVTARVPFGSLGPPCELVYRKSSRSLPLLADIMRVLLPANGHVAVHASACVFDGSGVLLMGWPKGGKTGALLAFAEAGAEFIGDEWIFLSPDDDLMYGMPSPIEVSHQHEWAIRRSEVRPSIGQRLLRSALRKIDVEPGRAGLRPFGTGTTNDVLRYLRRRARVSVQPDRLFARSASGDGCRPDAVFLIVDHDAPTPSVEVTDAASLAHSMTAVDHYEDAALLRLYDGWRFAVPGAVDPMLEHVRERRHALMCKAFERRPTYTVRQPYTASVEALFSALTSRL